jgi:hypothetical protein
MVQQPLVGQGLLSIEASRPHRHTTLGRTTLGECSVSTWQNTKFTIDIHAPPPVGFEPAIPASKRPQTHALDRAATGNGNWNYTDRVINRQEHKTYLLKSRLRYMFRQCQAVPAVYKYIRSESYNSQRNIIKNWDVHWDFSLQ